MPLKTPKDNLHPQCKAGRKKVGSQPEISNVQLGNHPHILHYESNRLTKVSGLTLNEIS